jgi:hypothetical protein
MLWRVTNVYVGGLIVYPRDGCVLSKLRRDFGGCCQGFPFIGRATAKRKAASIGHVSMEEMKNA